VDDLLDQLLKRQVGVEPFLVVVGRVAHGTLATADGALLNG
jgi:hypothetical protein